MSTHRSRTAPNLARICSKNKLKNDNLKFFFNFHVSGPERTILDIPAGFSW